MTKSDIGEREVHENSDITTKKKLCICFYFSLVFAQHGSSLAFVSIPVAVPFQKLACLCAHRFRMPLICR